MKPEVSTAVDELRRQFSGATITAREDGKGGAYIVMEPIELGSKYSPASTWVGFHIAPLYPYADIYPVFIGAGVKRSDGKSFKSPITPNHTFEGRPALQISRRNGAAQSGLQRAHAKLLKILDFLDKLP